MSFQGALRNMLEIATGTSAFRENPLVTLGLSHGVLTLGLTDDELYGVVHRYTIGLVRCIHPDYKPANAEEEEERARIRSAFELLQDRDTFNLALKEFRTLKSEERREMTVLRRSVALAQQRRTLAEEKLAILEGQRLKLEQERGEYERQLVAEAPIVPVLKKQLEGAGKEIERWNTMYRQRDARCRSLLKLTNNIHAYWQALGREPVGSTIWQSLATVKSVTTLSFFYQNVTHMTGLEESPDLREAVEFARTKLAGVLKGRLQRKSESNPEEREDMPIYYRLEKLPVKNGIIQSELRPVKLAKYKKKSPPERIIGALSLQAFSTYEMKSMNSLPHAFVARYISPLLFPGMVLLTVPAQDGTLIKLIEMVQAEEEGKAVKVTRYIRENTAKLVEYCQTWVNVRQKFDSHRIIVGVE